MYFKITDKIKDDMGAYIHKNLSNEHPELGTFTARFNNPSIGDYLVVKNGQIKALSAHNESYFNDVRFNYPCGTKEISQFIDNNRTALTVLSQADFNKEFSISTQICSLEDTLCKISESIKNIRSDSFSGSPSERKAMLAFAEKSYATKLNKVLKLKDKQIKVLRKKRVKNKEFER